ncbi:winged helix DNA-binding protein [Roseibium hamelinense]|uniref:Winged helix DNA-binding protein n=1 Tax=Roseibium hamelinense TaxID=150831 RepID=A0A562THT0_9HYPH|nr:winged helix-turn-helix domain-containing protein [Roseibium hamelinense]TWI93195.1 winged helix DNA-binding protein [Roseibium hamelinense]
MTLEQLEVPDNEQARRSARLIELHLQLTRIILDMSHQLTIDEAIIREVIFANDMRDRTTHISDIVEYTGLSVSSAHRKIKKLIDMDLVEHRKEGKRLVLRTSTRVLNGRYCYDGGVPVMDVAFDEISKMINDILRG